MADPGAAGYEDGARDRDRLRRGLGGVVLLLAVVAVLISTAIPRPFRGSASAAPIPSPPPIGSCVLFVGGQTTVVPCTEPHHGEVVRTWPADTGPTEADLPWWADSTVGSTQQPFGLPDATYDQLTTCVEPTQEWTGWTDAYYRSLTEETWFPMQPDIWQLYVPAPDGQRIGSRGWSACIMVPFDGVFLTGVGSEAQIDAGAAGPTYVGSMRSTAGPPTERQPDPFGRCFDTGSELAQTRCGDAHQIEWLASYQLSEDDVNAVDLARPVATTELYRQCYALAQEITGRSDPTFDGRLAIHVESIWSSSGSGPWSAETDLDEVTVITTSNIPDCTVRVIGDLSIYGSVIGLGDAPLEIR